MKPNDTSILIKLLCVLVVVVIMLSVFVFVVLPILEVQNEVQLDDYAERTYVDEGRNLADQTLDLTYAPTPVPDTVLTPETTYIVSPAPTPTLEPEPAPEPSSEVSIGDIIEFGNHNWLVLDVQGNQALIITENVIGHRAFHHTSGSVSWETSEIRQYLNGEFFRRFSHACQTRIATTIVINNNNPWSRYEVGGNNTTDRIFLLSIEEVVRYFGDSGMLAQGANMCLNQRLANQPNWFDWGIYIWSIHDQFSDVRIAYDTAGSATWWWLRSHGATSNAFSAIISANGFVNMNGFPVSYGVGGVRPTLWLKL